MKQVICNAGPITPEPFRTKYVTPKPTVKNKYKTELMYRHF